MEKIKPSSRILAVVCYILFWFGIFPFIIWLIRKKDSFVKKHAVYSIVLFYSWLLINIITFPIKLFIPYTAPLRLLIGLVFLSAWILGIIFSALGLPKLDEKPQ